MSLFKPAERSVAKLKVLIDGPSGSGKTKGGLRLLRGIVGPEGKIAVIDTENGKSNLYVTDENKFDVAVMNAPFIPEKYMKAITDAVEHGYDGLLIDSTTHEWQACLDERDKIPGNSYTAWKMVTPRHDAFIQAILQSPIHIVCTVRSKQDYVLESKDGKMIPVKLGMAPVQRDGLEYEFDLQYSVDTAHFSKVTKDRLEIYGPDDYLQLTEQEGEKLLKSLT